MFHATAIAIVAPNEPTRRAQVGSTRRPKRAAAARKRPKKRMSGSPRFAELSSPGTGNPIDSVENTWWW